MRPFDAGVGVLCVYGIVWALKQSEGSLVLAGFFVAVGLWSLAGVAVPGAGPSGMIYLKSQSPLR